MNHLSWFFDSPDVHNGKIVCFLRQLGNLHPIYYLDSLKALHYILLIKIQIVCNLYFHQSYHPLSYISPPLFEQHGSNILKRSYNNSFLLPIMPGFPFFLLYIVYRTPKKYYQAISHFLPYAKCNKLSPLRY